MEEGSFVAVSYTGKVKSTQTIFDLTDETVAKAQGVWNKDANYGPQVVVVGAEHVLPALDKELKHMKVGEKKTFDVKEPFGPRSQERVQLIPHRVFKENGIEPRPGLSVELQGLLGRIQAVSGGRITVDFNHPLSGKDAVYELAVEKEITDKNEQLDGLLRLYLKKSEPLTIRLKDGEAEVILQGSLPREVQTRVWEDAKKYLKLKRLKFVNEFGE